MNKKIKLSKLWINLIFTYFLNLSDGLERKRSQLQIAPSQSLGEFRTLKKSSSCSTIYIDDSTVSQPNLKNTIKCVSLAIYYHIKNRKSSNMLDIFDEKLRPLTVSVNIWYLFILRIFFLYICSIWYLKYHLTYSMFLNFRGMVFLPTTISIIQNIDRSTSSSGPCLMLPS